jgi:hypothetical protein
MWTAVSSPVCDLCATASGVYWQSACQTPRFTGRPNGRSVELSSIVADSCLPIVTERKQQGEDTETDVVW